MHFLPHIVLALSVILTLFIILGVYKLRKTLPAADGSQPVSVAIAEASQGFLQKSNIYQLLIFTLFSPLVLLSIYASPEREIRWGTIVLFSAAGIAPLLLSGNIITASMADKRISAKVKENMHRVFRFFLYIGILNGLTLSLPLLPLFSLALYLFGGFSPMRGSTHPEILFFLCLPLSLAAFFYRGMSGIFTKSADQGIDMLRKTESVIPAKDIRNPAEILHKAGKIFSDRGAIGISLLESSFFALAMILYIALDLPYSNRENLLVLPFASLASGMVASLIGFFFIRSGYEVSPESLVWSLRLGNYTGTFVLVVITFPIFFMFLKIKAAFFLCFLLGVATANLIFYFSEYFTAENFRPVSAVSARAASGTSAVITSGLKYGMVSIVLPLALALFLSLTTFFLGKSGESQSSFSYGLYGLSLAFIGFMSQFISFLATSSIAASADSALAVCQLGDIDTTHSKKIEMIIPSARSSFAAIRLLSVFSMVLMALLAYLKLLSEANSTPLTNLLHAAGLLLGASLPYLISAAAIASVNSASEALVREIKRQFKEIPGILEGVSSPAYKLASHASNRSAFFGTLKAFFITLLPTILAGFLAGPHGAAGLILGFALSGFYWTILLHHAGSIWASARRKTEKDPNIARGSALEMALISADLTGDPLKDASAPLVSSGVKFAVLVTILWSDKLYLLFQMILKTIEA